MRDWRSYSWGGRRLARGMMLGLLVLLAVAWASGASVNLAYERIMGFPVRYVTVDMNDKEIVVAVAVARGFPTGLERWGSFLDRLKPDAAINGTYFSLNDNIPVGDVAVEGKLIHSGVVGTALCVDPDNRVTMRPGPQQVTPDWSGCRTVLCAGPRLLTDGVPDVNARAEGFRDPRVLGSAQRSAVAYRADGTLILMTIEADISLDNLALLCLKLGARDAMCLDGGTSSGLYAEGRTVSRPGRSLSNILVVYSSRWRFQPHADDLMPATLPVITRLLREPTPLAAPKLSLGNTHPIVFPRALGGYTNNEPVQPKRTPGLTVAPLVRTVRGMLYAPIPASDEHRVPRAGAPAPCMAAVATRVHDLPDVPASRVRTMPGLPDSLCGGSLRDSVPTLAPGTASGAMSVAWGGGQPATLRSAGNTRAPRQTGAPAARQWPAMPRPVAVPPPTLVRPAVSFVDLSTPMPRPDLCVFLGSGPSGWVSTTPTWWAPICVITPRVTPSALDMPGYVLRLIAPASPARGVCQVGVEIADVRVRRVVLRINGIVRATLTGSGGYIWDTARETEGSCLLEAVAWSADGEKLASETVRVDMRRGPG